MTQQDVVTKVMVAKAIGSSVGMTGGLIYAFKTKRKFWGYIGFGLLFGFIGGVATTIPAYLIASKKLNDESTIQPPLSENNTTV